MLLYLSYVCSVLFALISILVFIAIVSNTKSFTIRNTFITIYFLTYIGAQYFFLWSLQEYTISENLLLLLIIASIYLAPFYIISIITTKYYVETALLGWLIAEFIFINCDIGNQLLQLGVLLADIPYCVSWYAYTGIYGGSVWLLSICYLLHNVLEQNRFKLILFFILICPCAISFFIQLTDSRLYYGRNVVMIPISHDYDLDMAMEELERSDLSNVDFVIFSEGAITTTDKAKNVHPALLRVKRFAKQHPNSAICLGVFILSEHTWDNAIVVFAKDTIKYRYKILKVPFSEYIPYYSILSKIDYIRNRVRYPVTDRTNETNVFLSKGGDFVPLVCYEGISTKYVSEVIEQGANVVFVSSSNTYINSTHIENISNKIVSVNAIATHRYIVRCVENGKSVIASHKGTRTTISGADTKICKYPILLNDNITFYVANRELIHNTYISVLILLIVLIRNKEQKINHSNKTFTSAV